MDLPGQDHDRCDPVHDFVVSEEPPTHRNRPQESATESDAPVRPEEVRLASNVI